MPTIIVIDVSLSMTRPVPIADSTDTITRQQLGVQGLGVLLNHLHSHSRLEFVALIAFSSLYDVLCPFTRDFDLLRSKLNNLEEFDKTCLEVALHGVNSLVLDEWGTGTPCQVILVTDGSVGMGPTGLGACLAGGSGSPLPFSFPGSLSVMCLASPEEPGVAQTMPMYHRLVELAGGQGTLYMPEGPLSPKSVIGMFQRLAETQFSSFQGTLTCGNLSSSIVLSPIPQPYSNPLEVDSPKRSISPILEVCGFLDVADVGSPMVVSRHLVLPVYTGKAPEASNVGLKMDPDSDEESNNQDEGRMPSFCVLLHGALKVENMVALCLLGEDWYGMIYSWADTKKKSNIMLSIFQPGVNVIPWLGSLNNLGVLPPKEVSEGLPVKPLEKRSYAQNYVVWIRQAGLQSDIQKILRHARKLPDKTQQFYKVLCKLNLQFFFLYLNS
ncbi:hypothetical protein B566_EDAN005894 [Ephemera danica]|nr:hypothetical protein B566_EDAN005894 [Ephemera danica]